MLNVIKKRNWLKRGTAFLLAILMVFNQNILVRAEGNSGGITDSSAPAIVEIPSDATKVLQEEFKETTQPSAFTGAFVLDTENQQLNIAGVTTGGTTAKVALGEVTDAKIYTVEFDVKRTDEDNSGYMQIKYYNSEGTEISLSDTQKQTLRLRDKSTGKTNYNAVENYAVATGNWAHYKYDFDMEAQQITVTVTDNAGTIYTSQMAKFDAESTGLKELQFYIPKAGGAAQYSIDNFVAYYTIDAEDDGGSGDGTGGNTPDSSNPTIVEIPAGATKVLQEEFKEATQPTAFSGAFVLDTEKQQLNIEGITTGGTTAKVAFGKVDNVEKYTIEFDMKRTDEDSSGYMQMKYYDAVGTELSLSDTQKQTFRLRDKSSGKTIYNTIENYTVATGVWAHYKYELDMEAQQITVTVTDNAGTTYTSQTAKFDAESTGLKELQFYIPKAGGAARYSIDNFVAYYTVNAEGDGESGDGTGGDTPDSSNPTIVEIPAGATKVLQEEFKETTQPNAFSGAFVLDTEKQQLNIAGVSGGIKANISFGKIDDVEKYTVEFDMKRTDQDDSGYTQMKYFDSVGTEISLSDTRYQTFRLRDKSTGTTDYKAVENYAVATGNWAHYKYELDMEAQQITVTVTDNAGTTYTSQTAKFDAACENVYELQFYIPNAGSAARYSIDNFVVYYTGGYTGGEDDGVITNYITNEGFETVNDNPGDGFTGKGAQGWSKHGSWGYSARELDSEVFHSGSYSMKLGGGTTEDQVVVRQTINGLNPEKYYKLSGYIKAEKYYPHDTGKPVGPALRVDASTGSTTMYWIANVPVKPNTENTYDWTYTEIVFTPGSEQLYLSCRMEKGSGTVWYDDLSLVEYEPCVSVAMCQNSATLSGGEELQLSAVPYPAKEGDVIKWTSSNPEVATVDENGKVTASSVKSGEAIITATITEQICTKSTNISSVDVTDYCKVTVNAGESVEPIEAVKVDVKKINLVLGESDATINLITIPAAAKETTEFVWTTSDSSVAVVTDGYVVPVGEGTAVITASVKGDKTIADYCEVTVTKKESTSFEVSDFEIQENSEFDKKIQDSGYPKLLFSYNDIARIRQNAKTSHTAYTFTKMEQYADTLLENGMTAHKNEATGGRKLQSYLTNLAMTGYIKQDMKYIDRAIEIMMASAETYTVSDYSGMNGNLSLGDAAQAYAVGYDWLYPFMTAEEKQTIETLLDGLGTYMYGLGENTYTYPATATNHSSVTYGGLGLIGLVRNNQDWINRATETIIAYYQISSDETGFYNEGTDYMMYGALGAVTYSAALQRATGVDLIEQYSYMEENMDMLLYYFLPDRDSVLPIGDSYGTLCPMGSWMYLISKYQDAVSLWQYLEMTGAEGTQLYGLAESEGKGASAAYILIWADTSLEAKAPVEANTPVVKEFAWGYNVYRDGWDDDMDTLISFVSGKTTHRGHNQRDENSFAFYAKEEDFAIDPGYSPSETLSHNALLVDGVGQAVPGDQYDIYGEIIKSEKLADNIYYVEGNATDTYPDRVSVASYIRRMLVCTGEIPYIIVIDDIDKANDVKSNYSWLLQTSKTNKLLVEGNSAQIIGSNKGSVMDIQFPFEESVLMNIDTWGNITVGGAQGNYIPSGYSKTLEAVIPGADTRIVSVLTARGYDELAPVMETTGTSQNGTIMLSYYNGKADVISLNGNTITYEQIDIEDMEEPEVQEPLSKDELDALGAKSITMQISGTVQDFEKISIENSEIVVDVEEFIDVFENYTALDETVKSQLRESASNGNIMFDTACDIIDAIYSYNEELSHITVMVKEDVYKVTGSDINISSIQEDKITIQGIDTRTDQAQYPPQNAIDGNLDTYFTIQGDTGEPVILELGAEYEVYAVGMAFNQGSKRISRFDVQVSMDKENWETVRCAASSGATEGVEGYSFAVSNAKYVKILGYGNSVNVWNAIREIEIYGTAVTPTASPEIIVQGTVESYTKGSSAKVSIHCTGELNDFAGVWLNDKEVDSTNYTVTAGSIIVTFNTDYVETLSEGEYIFTIKYNNGASIESKLTISAQKADESDDDEDDDDDDDAIEVTVASINSSSPATGDSSNLSLWGVLMLVAVVVCGFFTRKVKQLK